MAVPVSLLLFAMLLFGNSLDNGFVLDDITLIRDNPLIREISGLPVLFRSGYWEPEAKIGLYRPLVVSSYALNYSLGQRDPWGYHLANIVLHAFVCLLVLALYRRLVKDPQVSAAAAFLFAALAIHTEVVANVVGRAEILWALFFLLSFLAYDSGGRAGGRFRGSRCPRCVGVRSGPPAAASRVARRRPPSSGLAKSAARLFLRGREKGFSLPKILPF